jgi:L-iditol 2-dehydrogenase
MVPELPEEMTAAVLYAPGDLRVERAPVPTPGAGEVLVKVAACGVCGSDVPRVLVKGTYRFPLIPGHEFAGLVAALGEGVDDWRLGDRVTVFPLLPCSECAWCRLGVYEVCDDYDYLGSRCNGAFAEYVAAPAWNLVRVPDSVPLRHAAMSEPAACALHAVRPAGLQEGNLVAVLGAGPIGLMLAQWARGMGAGRVVVADIIDEKLAVARNLGFEATCNVRREPLSQAIAAAGDGLGAHVVLEAAGVPQTVLGGIEILRKLGVMVVMGNPAEPVTLPAPVLSSVLRKEATLRGTWNSSFKGSGPDDWTETLRAMADGRLQLGPLITHEYPLREANAAFAMMSSGEEFFNKVLFVLD